MWVGSVYQVQNRCEVRKGTGLSIESVAKPAYHDSRNCGFIGNSSFRGALARPRSFKQGERGQPAVPSVLVLQTKKKVG